MVGDHNSTNTCSSKVTHHCEIDQENVVAVDDDDDNNNNNNNDMDMDMDMDMDIDDDAPQQQNDDIEEEEDGGEIAIGDDNNNNNWEFTKTLTASDVASQQSRLILPTTFVHNHIFLNNEELRNRIDNDKQEVEIFFFDCNLEHGFLLNLKKWKTNSYVLISGWQKRVVDARDLKKGDVIGLRWDPLYFGLKFGVLHQNVANLNVANL